MDMVNISVGTGGIVALLGYGVVFLGLITLMLVVMLMSRIMIAKAKRPLPLLPRHLSLRLPHPQPLLLPVFQSVRWSRAPCPATFSRSMSLRARR